MKKTLSAILFCILAVVLIGCGIFALKDNSNPSIEVDDSTRKTSYAADAPSFTENSSADETEASSESETDAESQKDTTKTKYKEQFQTVS